MLLLDGDVLLYKIGYWRNTSPLNVAIVSLEDYLENLRSHIPVRYFEEEPKIFVGDGNKTFRHDVATIKGYKDKRTAEKPVHFYELKKHLINNHSAKVCSHYEVDDYIGFYSKSHPDTLMCSTDKDIATIPGMHYHLDKKKIYRVTELGLLKLQQMKSGKVLRGSGMRFFWAQMLMGDKVDNIPGIPGYGPVETYKTLCNINDCLSLGKTVYAIYLKHFRDNCDKIFIEIGTLLWILREPNRFFIDQPFFKEIIPSHVKS